MRSLLIVLSLFLTGICQAQTWPSKPVRVIVNVAAGGVADVTARVLGARMQETLGQAFLVENRAGGDGYIGFDAVARSDPDGFTLLYSPGSSVMIAPPRPRPTREVVRISSWSRRPSRSSTRSAML